MTDVAEMIHNARAIRLRLTRPPNAVPDAGINLKRRQQPEVKKPKIEAVVKITEEVRPPSRVRLEMILRAVEDSYAIGINEIRGHCRKPHLVLPRYVAIHLALRHLTKLSTISIGRLFNRDHTTIIHARKRMQDRLSVDPDLAARVEAINQSLLDGHYD